MWVSPLKRKFVLVSFCGFVAAEPLYRYGGPTDTAMLMNLFSCFGVEVAISVVDRDIQCIWIWYIERRRQRCSYKTMEFLIYFVAGVMSCVTHISESLGD